MQQRVFTEGVAQPGMRGAGKDLEALGKLIRDRAVHAGPGVRVAVAVEVGIAVVVQPQAGRQVDAVVEFEAALDEGADLHRVHGPVATIGVAVVVDVVIVIGPVDARGDLALAQRVGVLQLAADCLVFQVHVAVDRAIARGIVRALVLVAADKDHRLGVPGVGGCGRAVFQRQRIARDLQRIDAAIHWPGRADRIQVHVHLDGAVAIVLGMVIGQFDTPAVLFVAQLDQAAAQGRFGPVHFEPVAGLVVLAVGAVDHREPVEALVKAIARQRARDAAPVRAPGQGRATALRAPVGQKVACAHGFIAHRTGGGAETGIGGGGAGLDLDRLQEGRVDHIRSGVVPAGRPLRHAVDADRQVRLLQAKDVDALGRARAARDGDRRIAGKQFGHVRRLQDFQILGGDADAAGRLDVLLPVRNQRQGLQGDRFGWGFLCGKRCAQGKRRDARQCKNAAKFHGFACV